MNTIKQVMTAFCAVGAKGLSYKRQNGLYFDVSFLVGKSWISFDRNTICNLQAYKIPMGA